MEVSEIIPYGPCHVNHPNPERARLLERIAKRMGLVHPCYWAGMLLADIDVVRDVCETVESSVANQIGAWDERMKDAVKAWAQSVRVRASAASTMDSTPQDPPVALVEDTTSGGEPSSRVVTPSPGDRRVRSEPESKKAARRDNKACAITGLHFAEIAHIFPFYLGKAQYLSHREKLWAMLKFFWKKERVIELKNILYDGETAKPETCANLICLSPSLHKAWQLGEVAFKPVFMSEDKKRLILEVYWLGTAHVRRRGDSKDLRTIPRELPSSAHLGLSGRLDGRQLHTGDTIEMRTADPDDLPLPCYALLELQWFLNRVVNLAGAADVNQSYGRDSDGDEDSNPGMIEDDSDSLLGSPDSQHILTIHEARMPLTPLGPTKHQDVIAEEVEPLGAGLA